MKILDDDLSQLSLLWDPQEGRNVVLPTCFCRRQAYKDNVAHSITCNLIGVCIGFEQMEMDTINL